MTATAAGVARRPAATSPAGRRERLDALVRPRRTLNFVFFGTLAVMAAHEAEHVAQVMEKDVLLNACPTDCRGLLGFLFDVEWIHFLYNTGLFLALAGLFVAYRMWQPAWRRAAPAAWAGFVFGVFAIQGYHVVEHVVKLDQWFASGRMSPTPGIAGRVLGPPVGREFSLIELHFALNTAVFVSVAVAYFGFGLHRHVLPGRPRLAMLPAATVAFLLLVPVALTWALAPPTVRLAAGVHEGPLVLDRPQKLVGEPGAVVRGGIRVTADGVVVRGVRVVGGENGIEVDGARDVLIRDVEISGAELDGINVRRASVTIQDCVVSHPATPFGQGIEVSFAIDLRPSLVRRCTVVGGQEGIVTHSAKVRFADNRVEGTTLRAITVTEMAMGTVERNTVVDAVGVGIFCGDYSVCDVRRNVVVGTRADRVSGDGFRAGYAIQSHFGATARIADNRLSRNERGVVAVAAARLVRG